VLKRKNWHRSHNRQDIAVCKLWTVNQKIRDEVRDSDLVTRKTES
jgi:hypothetical protein